MIFSTQPDRELDIRDVVYQIMDEVREWSDEEHNVCASAYTYDVEFTY